MVVDKSKKEARGDEPAAPTEKAAAESVNTQQLLNILTIDIQQCLNYAMNFHETWGLVLRLVLSLAYLYLKLKEGVLIGFGFTFIIMVVNFQIAKKIGQYYDRSMQYKDQRIELTNEVVKNIKQIKSLNLADLFFRKIMSIRKNEFRQV